MAKIPLRAYVKEIENLIERGEIEQAVSHAKNILKSYPKHIDTYRLLGKAFLESQRYSEAADILQRVLSVLPDDFISQIGMSIIREDEGNLDAAIWHMERAYEVQPFNPAVQDELRRLYGRRDGIEPPKIRLTRGALVRMYTRGELYPQAIAETRAALAEDPQRMDLLVLLARLYYLSDHKNDAAEVCSELIRKLPYCFEANRLLAEFLPSTNRAEEAQKFLQRIFALDPYSAFVSPTAPTSDQVPDQAVMVEQFTWDAAMEEAQPPEWTRTVGVEWEETQEEELPDWLNTLKPEPSQTGMLSQPLPTTKTDEGEEKTTLPDTSPVEETEGAGPAQEDVFPEWMKEAGWVPSDRKADEIMAEQEEAESEEISPGELPDWVQSMAPQDTAQPEEEAERTDWLETILTQPGETESEKEAETISPAAEETQDLDNLPDWIGEAGNGTEAPALSETTPGELPDWFTQMEDEQAPGEEAKPVEFEGLPDWSQLGEPSTPELSTSPDETPDWLRSFEPQAPETSAPAEPEVDWLQSTNPEAGEATGFTDWLNSGKTEETSPSETPFEELATPEQPVAPEEPVGEEPPAMTPQGTLPDWLQAEEPGSVEPGTEFEAATTEAAAHEAAEPEVTALQGAETEIAEPQAETTLPPVEEVSSSTTAPDFSDMDAAMAWLESLAAKQGADEATLVTPPEQRTEKPPEWVTKEAESQEAEQALVDEQPGQEEEPVQPAEITSPLPDWLQPSEGEPAEETSASIPEASAPAAMEAEVPDLSDMDTAMAWLESLAAKQGADEATLVTPPEQRTEKPPEWVMKEMEGEASTPVEATSEEVPPAEEAALPDWLEEAIQEGTTGLPKEEQASVELEDTEQPVAETLPEIVPSEEAEPPVVEGQPEPSAETDLDSAFAWLESLAAKQGADEATLVTPPDERLEAPPDWIQQEQVAEEEIPASEPPSGVEVAIDTQATEAAAQEPAQEEEVEQPEMTEPAIPEEMPSAKAEMPEWLQDLQAEPEKGEEPVAEQEARAEQLPAEEIPAWLENIGQEEAIQTPAADESAPWTVEQEAFAAEQQVGEEETQPEAPAPEWLQEAAADQIAEVEEVPAASEEQVVPDWLSELEEETEPANNTAHATSLPSEFHSAWEPEAEYSQAAEKQPPVPSSQSLGDVQKTLNQGQLDQALDGYNALIQNGQHLEETIHDLRDALYRYPVDINLWQTLGDAYARNNQLQEALDAYTKAEELLR